MDDDYDSEESENDIVSIEETYKEVGQYKTQISPAKPNQMTVIEEEEVEDSILQSNFNSQLAANVTLNSQNMRTKKHESSDLKNSDLSAVMEEYDARVQYQ